LLDASVADKASAQVASNRNRTHPNSTLLATAWPHAGRREGAAVLASGLPRTGAGGAICPDSGSWVPLQVSNAEPEGLSGAGWAG